MNDIAIRSAARKDIPYLAMHHRKMFEEIWEQKEEKIDPAVWLRLEEAYVCKLERELPEGTCRAWVVIY
jgi:mRNA-degrading endonuclease RelE of RelBE toxin-antitoxin system